MWDLCSPLSVRRNSVETVRRLLNVDDFVILIFFYLFIIKFGLHLSIEFNLFFFSSICQRSLEKMRREKKDTMIPFENNSKSNQLIIKNISLLYE